MKGGELAPVGKKLLRRDAFGALVIGASGTGKSTTVEKLQQQGLAQVEPTKTTRAIRPSEHDTPPCDHDFFSMQKFKCWEQNGWFIATKLIYGSWYGVPRFAAVPEGVIPFMVLKPDFVEPVLEEYPNMQTYQIEATEATVFRRMHDRGQNNADIAERLRLHAAETTIGRRLADCIFKNEGRQEDTIIRLVEQVRADQMLWQATASLSEASAATNATIDLPYDATETFA